MGDSLGWKQNQEPQLGLGSGLGDDGEGATARTRGAVAEGIWHSQSQASTHQEGGSRKQEEHEKGIRWGEKVTCVNWRDRWEGVASAMGRGEGRGQALRGEA